MIDAALDLPMHEKNAHAEQDGADCGKRSQHRICAGGYGNEPADQGDFRHDHYPEPEPEIDELLLEAIELRHSVPCGRK